MKSSAVALAVLLCALPSYGDCAPKRILHVVMTMDDPKLADDDFARKPRTVYRLGEKYGIVEEGLDEARKLHLRVVVNEPDVWVVNLVDHSGRHIVDPGPTFIFRAPLFATLESKHWVQLEIGCEVPFMKAVHATAEALEGGGTKYVHTAEEMTVTLYTGKNDLPKRVEVTSPKMTYAMNYTVYEMLDDDSPARFAKPQGVEFSEADSAPR